MTCAKNYQLKHLRYGDGDNISVHIFFEYSRRFSHRKLIDSNTGMKASFESMF